MFLTRYFVGYDQMWHLGRLVWNGIKCRSWQHHHPSIFLQLNPLQFEMFGINSGIVVSHFDTVLLKIWLWIEIAIRKDAISSFYFVDLTQLFCLCPCHKFIRFFMFWQLLAFLQKSHPFPLSKTNRTILHLFIQFTSFLNNIVVNGSIAPILYFIWMLFYSIFVYFNIIHNLPYVLLYHTNRVLFLLDLCRYSLDCQLAAIYLLHTVSSVHRLIFILLDYNDRINNIFQFLLWFRKFSFGLLEVHLRPCHLFVLIILLFS